MKRIAALLLAILATATHADTWEQNNRSGGRLVLTDRPCEDPPTLKLREMYSYTGAGVVMRGCWVLIDDMVHIGWEDGHHSVHRSDSFKEGVIDQPYVPPVPVNNLYRWIPLKKSGPPTA